MFRCGADLSNVVDSEREERVRQLFARICGTTSKYNKTKWAMEKELGEELTKDEKLLLSSRCLVNEFHNITGMWVDGEGG
jgi:hypothetical protein